VEWTDTGSLAKATDKTGTMSYVYDADGNRLLRRDPAGTTLHLPGGTEIRKPVNGAATGRRYYAVGGTTVAVRTPAGVTWPVSDHHGTGSATVSDDGKGPSPGGVLSRSATTAAPRPARGRATRDSSAVRATTTG
jgi:YD repeat-containing protein